MRELRLGVIGMSEGNGHPYSWSAIFNGYDPAIMADCPFSVIPEYLARQEFPCDAIAGAKVTHVWTQDRRVSEQIAAAAHIHVVLDRIEDMVDSVDAVLLARDDAETHAEFARPFLVAGLPVYIDKPLALSVSKAEALYALQRRPGQIFTCSALAWGREFALTDAEREALGPLRYVEAITIKDWDRYAIHVIEPLMNLLVSEGPIIDLRPARGSIRHLDLAWRSGLEGRITALGSTYGPMCIRLFGQAGWREMRFVDTFNAFKSALLNFTDIVRGAAPMQDYRKVLDIIRIVEAGRRG